MEFDDIPIQDNDSYWSAKIPVKISIRGRYGDVDELIQKWEMDLRKEKGKLYLYEYKTENGPGWERAVGRE